MATLSAKKRGLESIANEFDDLFDEDTADNNADQVAPQEDNDAPMQAEDVNEAEPRRSNAQMENDADGDAEVQKQNEAVKSPDASKDALVELDDDSEKAVEEQKDDLEEEEDEFDSQMSINALIEQAQKKAPTGKRSSQPNEIDLSQDEPKAQHTPIPAGAGFIQHFLKHTKQQEKKKPVEAPPPKEVEEEKQEPLASAAPIANADEPIAIDDTIDEEQKDDTAAVSSKPKQQPVIKATLAGCPKGNKRMRQSMLNFMSAPKPAAPSGAKSSKQTSLMTSVTAQSKTKPASLSKTASSTPAISSTKLGTATSVQDDASAKEKKDKIPKKPDAALQSRIGGMQSSGPSILPASDTCWGRAQYPDFSHLNGKVNIVSWNVNGLQATINKGKFQEMLKTFEPDIVMLNETKTDADKVARKFASQVPRCYEQHWNCSKIKKGYSGVAMLTKIKPIAVTHGIGIEKHDQEGRVLTFEFEKFFLVAVYTPNAGEKLQRLDYRVNEWDVDFYMYLRNLEGTGKAVICGGDLNVAHQEIDCYNPEGKDNVSNYTPQERQSFDEFISTADWVDTYRFLYPTVRDKYTTWWELRNMRPSNKGWRIDYFLINRSNHPWVEDSLIHDQVEGSDHCPIQLFIDMNKSEITEPKHPPMGENEEQQKQVVPAVSKSSKKQKGVTTTVTTSVKSVNKAKQLVSKVQEEPQVLDDDDDVPQVVDDDQEVMSPSKTHDTSASNYSAGSQSTKPTTANSSVEKTDMRLQSSKDDGPQPAASSCGAAAVMTRAKASKTQVKQTRLAFGSRETVHEV